MIHENELRHRGNGFERNNSWAMMETDRCPQSMDSRQFDALERGPRSTRFFDHDYIPSTYGRDSNYFHSVNLRLVVREYVNVYVVTNSSERWRIMPNGNRLFEEIFSRIGWSYQLISWLRAKFENRFSTFKNLFLYDNFIIVKKGATNYMRYRIIRRPRKRRYVSEMWRNVKCSISYGLLDSIIESF